MKLLILENNRGEDGAPHRVTLETMRIALDARGIPLESIPVTEDLNQLELPSKDVCYCGAIPPDLPEWEICLRTVYVPTEYGKDFFQEKLKLVIDNFQPDCILSHLALYGRGGRFRDYPAVSALLPYTKRGIQVIVYTGTADDGASLIADTNGRIEYRYNERKIDTQADIILELLGGST